MEWKVILFYKTYGYVPLRQEFFEKMLQQKVYNRTKDSPKKGSGTIWKREYDVLRLMNENSSISFAEMDSELGLGGEASRYTYMRLLEQGIIKRPTINITKPPMVKYEAIFQVAKHNHNDWSSRIKDILRNIIGESSTVNKYSFVGDTEDPDGVLYISPVFNDGDSSRLSQDIAKSTGSDSVHTSIISDVIAGSIGIRRFDNYYSNQNRIIMEYGEKSLYPKIEYKLTK
jgi:DNA-binding Lrp family transcriptional regulator